MGKFKEIEIESLVEKVGEEAELLCRDVDSFLQTIKEISTTEDLSFSERELMEQHHAETLDAVRKVEADLEYMIYRHKYYQDPLSVYEIEKIANEIKRIRRDFA